MDCGETQMHSGVITLYSCSFFLFLTFTFLFFFVDSLSFFQNFVLPKCLHYGSNRGFSLKFVDFFHYFILKQIKTKEKHHNFSWVIQTMATISFDFFENFLCPQSCF